MGKKIFYSLIFALVIISQLSFVVAAQAVGVSCTKTGDGVTIEVNEDYMPFDVDMPALTDTVNSVWKNQLTQTWGGSFKTADCQMPVSFHFNVNVTNDCTNSGHICIHVLKTNGDFASTPCPRGPACMSVGSVSNPSPTGYFLLSVSNPISTAEHLTTICNPIQSFDCSSETQYAAAHETGHAMGLRDEYIEPGNPVEKNIMGLAGTCDNDSSGTKPIQKDIDKIVQIFCGNLNDVCISSSPNDQCDPSGGNKCIVNNKCYDTSRPPCTCANGTTPTASTPTDSGQGYNGGSIQLQVPLFDYTQATGLPEYISKVLYFSMIVIIPLAIIMIIRAGIQWLVAAGNPQKIAAAKKQIASAFLGLLLALLCYIILALVGITELRLPGIQTIAPETDTDLGAASDPTLTPDELSALKASNPYKAICDQYGSKPYATVAQECKALGDTPPPSMNIVSMGSYGADSSQRATVDGLAAFKKSADCVKAKFGKTITATGWRSAARQFTIKLEKGDYAARPCCSNHGTGAAFDVKMNGASVQSWSDSDMYLKDCFAQNGLYAKIKGGKISEPWHFSPSGH